MEVMNTNNMPDKMPRKLKGNNTFKKAFQGAAPNEDAAGIKLPGMVFNTL